MILKYGIRESYGNAFLIKKLRCEVKENIEEGGVWANIEYYKI